MGRKASKELFRETKRKAQENEEECVKAIFAEIKEARVVATNERIERVHELLRLERERPEREKRKEEREQKRKNAKK